MVGQSGAPVRAPGSTFTLVAAKHATILPRARFASLHTANPRAYQCPGRPKIDARKSILTLEVVWVPFGSGCCSYCGERGRGPVEKAAASLRFAWTMAPYDIAMVFVVYLLG